MAKRKKSRSSQRSKKSSSSRKKSSSSYRKPSSRFSGEKKSSWQWVIGLIIALFGFFVLIFLGILFLGFIALIFGEDIPKDGNVAVIDIKGTIMADKGSGLGFDGVTSSANVVDLIEEAEEADDIDVILFEINSPGGSAVASAEISAAIDAAQKPTIAVIREVGASGAFWSAMSCDEVFAHPLSVTGSIGVISSYLQFSGFLDRYNVTYERLVSGDFKDAGSPLKNLTELEREKLQTLIDEIHEEFILSVASHRNMESDKVRKHADGFIFLGREAEALGFVDHLGTKSNALTYIETKYNITAEPVDYKKTPTLIEVLGGVFSGNFYSIGRGIGDSMTSVDNAYLPKV